MGERSGCPNSWATGTPTNRRRAQPNTALQLTNTDAAHSALRSPCLLSVLAAECHVRLTLQRSDTIFHQSGSRLRRPKEE